MPCRTIIMIDCDSTGKVGGRGDTNILLYWEEYYTAIRLIMKTVLTGNMQHEYDLI